MSITSKSYLHNIMDSIDALGDILDTENYGMCIVDASGKIIKWNYHKLFHKEEAEVIGKPVVDVIENTRLHIVVQTGEKELFQLQNINGQDVITNRIPLYHDGRIVGAAGTIIYRNTRELSEINDRMKRMESRVKAYKSELAKMYSSPYTFDSIITHSDEFTALINLGKMVAKTDASVLIQGESGTGKELFAGAMHNESLVSNQPFVSINCGSIPKDLIESELFGYEAGAFTGASPSGKIGKFALAGEGTLFLDEIATMPMDMQTKLLRVLESREFERVGSNKKERFSARVIAATNENLIEAVEAGHFRQDLLYRLNVVTIDLLPLRKRKEDILPLAATYINEVARRDNSHNYGISDSAMHLLKLHDWPGNVRELKNVLQRALILSQGKQILPEHLPSYILAYEPEDRALRVGYYRNEMDKVERRLIEEALAESGGNKMAAANILGIQRSQLYKKIEKYGLK